MTAIRRPYLDPLFVRNQLVWLAYGDDHGHYHRQELVDGARAKLQNRYPAIEANTDAALVLAIRQARGLPKLNL